MAALSQFERFILPFINNPPVPAVHDAVLDACREFCDRARVVTRWLDPVSILANEPELDVESPEDGLEPSSVVSLVTSTGVIDPVTEADLERKYPKGWITEKVDSVSGLFGWLQTDEAVLRIVPIVTVSVTDAVRLRVALRPALDATEVPDILLNRYHDAIRFGALKRLHEHNAAYADPTRVQGYATAFDAQVAKHGDDYMHGLGKPRLRTGLDVFP